jgi:hypothetical protein
MPVIALDTKLACRAPHPSQSKNCFTARVRHARVAVADVGGEELDEAVAGAFALGAVNRRQRVQARADERASPGTDPPKTVNGTAALSRSSASAGSGQRRVGAFA